MSKTTAFWMAFLLMISASCNNLNKNFFTKKTPKEIYKDVLKKKDPQLLSAWDYAGKYALEHPLIITDSYAEYGLTKAGTADANAFQISLKPGQQIIANYDMDSLTMPAFLEIWKRDANEMVLLASADSINKTAIYFSIDGADYIIKFQPKIEVSANYNLIIQVAAGLEYPIDPKAKSSIGSLWGDPRDGGVRKHEGIDIFAAKGSKIIAAADGVVTNVGETEIGGKVVSLRPKGQDLSIYYAHLDEQLVQYGQAVTKGQVIGTVGNTGNAITTVPHLHLGIYTRNGAVDPLLFVKKLPIVKPIAPKKLQQQLKFSSTALLYPSPAVKNPLTVAKGFIAVTEGYTNAFYRVRLEDGTKGFVKEADYKKAK